ncbi:MAG: hypothetical protein BroJett024_16600 [Alphaproteobacteria bacterium]|nr:MAG: hypothetical protein BroJett024_16600 [Alphaproteobacteria bacterium]
MEFLRADLQADLVRLRSSRSAPERAIGDNFAFEERVCDARRDAFEADGSTTTELLTQLADHFRLRVQGALRSHIPVTFTSINEDAIYKPDIEVNQKVVRLECIDDALRKIGRSFSDIEAATRPGRRDKDVITQLLGQWQLYPGARPSFIAFKSEVASDLDAPDWPLRLRNRLGLGHYAPATGQRQSFALMEYLVKDVIAEWRPLEARGALRAFAFPTVLESQGSPHFFPSPRELPSGFTVDLGGAGRPSIREMLHIRITYMPDHLVRVGELVGPLAQVRLGSARDSHLDQIRRDAGRADFGAPISGDVDE